MQKKRKIKKAVAKKVKELKIIKAIEVIDWSKVPNNTYFQGKYNNKIIFGKIRKKLNAVYLLQNVTGSLAHNTDMRYEQWICSLNTLVPSYGNFKELKLLSGKPSGYKTVPTMEIAGRTAIVYKGYVTVGCQRVPNEKIRKLYSLLKN